MEISTLILHIEALIFASDKPLTSLEITDLVNQAFGFMEDKIIVEQIDAAIEGIVEKYNSEYYPFDVRQSGGGWQFLTKKDYHKTVAQLNGEKFLKRLSAAALETLAIIAYKQPVTKGEIEAIRGVSSDYAVQKLLEKELIIITGRNEKLPGHPLVYATSKNFMDYFGINSAEDLPKIKEVLVDQMVEPTRIHHTDFEGSENLLVSEEGQLVIVSEENKEDADHVNGHSFNMQVEEDIENSSAEQNDAQGLTAEEVTEENTTGENFNEGDEIEWAKETGGYGNNENSSDEKDNEETSGEDDSIEDNNDDEAKE
jgi:segregation and condensation protein B